MLYPDHFSRAAAVLEPSDFSIHAHSLIFSRLQNLTERGEPIDYATVGRDFIRTNQIDSIGGLSYISDLTRDVPQLVNFDTYCGRVKEASVRRKGAMVAQTTLNRLLVDATTPVDEILANNVERTQGLRGQTGSGTNEIDQLPPVTVEGDEEFLYIVEPELPEGSIVVFTGEAGSGKSTLVTALARQAIAKGRHVLVLDRENPRKVVQERLRRLCVIEDERLRWWGPWAAREVPGLDAQVLKSWVREQEKPPLIVVENLGAFHEGDENDASDMRAFFNPCRSLADLGACVTVMHNSGKSDTSKDFRGSSAFKDAIDQAFHVQNTSGDGKLERLTLRCYKSRYGVNGSILYRYADGAFEKDSGPRVMAISTGEKLTSLLRINPGITSEKFERIAGEEGLRRFDARTYLENGVLGGLILREKGARKSWHYSLIQ
jgi:energy-coupling factor transporter ATP-binding protein EcfA2